MEYVESHICIERGVKFPQIKSFMIIIDTQFYCI